MNFKGGFISVRNFGGSLAAILSCDYVACVVLSIILYESSFNTYVFMQFNTMLINVYVRIM